VAALSFGGDAIDRTAELTDARVRERVRLIAYHSDILAGGLDVIFCGINPASTAAADGRNFSNSNNRFWPVLHLAGFTDVRLQPKDELRLLEYGCGITAVVDRPTKRADQVLPAEFRQARPEFEAKMRRCAPRVITFLGKRALAAMVGRADIGWGLYSERFAETTAWVLPNPSGLNRGFTLGALVCAYTELRHAFPPRT